MSITVRLWSKEDLEAVKTDKWLATLLMNTTTLTREEAHAYPYGQRRTYWCGWDAYPDDDTKVYATDVRMLKRFLEAEYTRLPDWIHQIITQYRPVTF